MPKIADARPSGPTNARQLATFEKYVGHPLPPAYRSFLLRYNGGRPEPDAFQLRAGRRQEEHIVMCFFPMRALTLGQIEVDDPKELLNWPLHCAWDDLRNDLEHLYKTKLDPPLLPIATDGLSNYVSIVLAGEKKGAMVFLDHKTGKPWPLAPTFSSFLHRLRPRRQRGHWTWPAPDGPPELVAINHDDHHARHIGRTADGRQFFLTILFEPETERSAGNEFVALFLFNKRGKLIEAKIDQFGPRRTMDDQKRRAVYEKRLRELGKVSFQRIEVAPFAIKRFGTRFGLIAQPTEEDEDEWVVELHPGNCMAFFKPWDSGEYDT